MAQMVNVNFKMDADVKKMESACAAMGCKNRHPRPICTQF